MNAETKIHLFIGPASSGKTMLANEISNRLPGKFYEINGRDTYRLMEDPFLFECVTMKTEVLFIDDLLSFDRTIDRIKSFTSEIIGNVRHASPFRFKVKMVIVTICTESDSSFYANLGDMFVIHRFPLSYVDGVILKEKLIRNLTTNE